ncbi:MAG: carboxypeptidase-like regulatory domain-containing protein, partial [Mucilaginibacter sp.]
MPKLLVITLFFLMPLSCFAQYTISGKILNSATKKPVANADVFINNSTGGTTTYANGDFKLFNIRNGKYTLIISEIGYNDMIRQIQVNNNDIDLGDIMLVQSNKTLKEVVIKPKEIPSEYFYNFKEQFLGKSDIAHDCRILNPEILDIGYNRTDSSYTASSDGYLIIENPDLGYRIKYKLLDFYYMSNTDSP